jgi:hypothetical protein
MKKLGKLSINPEKLIENQELVNLRGGYPGSGDRACMYYSDQAGTELICCELVDTYADCDGAAQGAAVTTGASASACDSENYCN